MATEKGDVYNPSGLNASSYNVAFHPLEDQVGPYIPATLNVTVLSSPSTPPTTSSSTQETIATSSGHVLAYVLVPLGSLAFIILLSFMVIFILRKSKMDRLRHHLMPLYNFDPMEEEGDWESELLEEEKEQQVALNIRSHHNSRGPKLKFHTDA